MPKRIMVVDDEAKIIKIVEHALKKEGFEVIKAGGGEEALELAAKERPDLVLLDIMMPGMDGFETFQRLKAIMDVPVVILSARSDEIDKVVGFRMGVDDYQTKPFSPTELALRIKAVLRRVGENNVREKDILDFGGLSIDSRSRLLSVGGQKVELTPKEFDLLWLLASSPNRVFTKGQILDLVWDSAYYGDENTVMVHIRRLREKVEEEPSSPKYIKTVWGTGYKFESPR
ncbi:MAG: PhoP family transcriptional regulator [Peptococcaceae bacterium BICA1-7]|nr:MAG: PhoP family transcriptional regulator [Peptococcaceae bacterium BICA1-7]HBV96560.1 DNA-binding response regulator [Desulfotomaculum sp.]